MEKGIDLGFDQSLDLKGIIGNYLRHWKWFLLSIVLCGILAFLYLRYATPKYQAKASIQVLEENSSSPELSVFQDLNIFSGSQQKVADEVEILKSRSNFIQLAQELKLNINMKVLGNIKHTELYGPKQPFIINFISQDSTNMEKTLVFFIQCDSETRFVFSLEEDAPGKAYSFGNIIQTPVGEIVITPKLVELSAYFKDKIEISVSPMTMVAQGYKTRAKLSLVGEKSNIIELSLNDAVPERAKDVLNSLIRIYNENAVSQKKAIADKTSEFINDRIGSIYANLSTVDQSAEEFKSNRGLTDIVSQSNLNLSVGAESEQELQRANIELNIASSMKDLLDSQATFDILPTNVGLSDPTIASTTAKYNELVTERNRLLKSSNEKNPVIVNLDQQLQTIKRSMRSSLNSMSNNLTLEVNSLSTRLAKVNSRIYSTPKNERALRDITRKQQTTESLYLYLLQKREEAQITYASASPRSNVIESAYLVDNKPISPKINLIYLAAIVFGMAIPFSVIYSNNLLDNKVHNKLGLEKLVRNTPVLAELPRLGKKDSKIIKEDDRSVLSESLRIFRTNLDYLIRSKKNAGKNNVIFVTSSVPGEGKTFVSSNLAMILTSTKKRVLLIGADIRNPKVYVYFSDLNADGKKPMLKSSLGLTEYLIDHTIKLNEIVSRTKVDSDTIDVIYSGKIPPNPAELLMSDRIGNLFSQASEMYDYVIVDTAPLLVVADTLVINKYANHTIYVTRAGVTETKILEYPVGLKKEGKINGLTFVVNGVKTMNLGYTGKYGYGYGAQSKKWWKI